MFSPDDDFLAEHHLDLRNYYPHHQPPPSSTSATSAALYRHLKSSAITSATSALSNYSRSQYQDSNLGSSITSTASRIAIREANDHLQILNQRVGDLEDIIRSQGSALSGKDIEFRRQIQDLKECKERQISELSMVIAKLEGKNQELASEIQEKADHLNGCQQKLLMLDQILTTSLPSLEQLICNLKQFSLNNPDMVQLTNPVTSTNADGSGEGVRSNALTVESANALQRSPALLSPAVRSPAIRSPAARTNPIVVEEIPTAHLISATSALINSSIVDVQSTDSGNASDSSRTNSYGQVLDELKEVQQYQHQHAYPGMVSSPRRRSLEKQKPVDEAVPIPTIVETSIQNDLAKDVDITDELNRGRKSTRKLPHAFGKNEGTNGTSNPVQISSQLMSTNLTARSSSQLSPSVNRVIKTSTISNNGQLMASPSSAIAGGMISNPASTYSLSSPMKGYQNQSQLMSANLSGYLQGSSGSQYQQQRSTIMAAVARERSSNLANIENISRLNSEKRQVLQPPRYDFNNYNNNNYGRNFEFCDEDDLDYDEEEEYVDDDAPPPPAPPPSTNTSNISLPSLQAPRRYIQSSYHVN